MMLRKAPILLFLPFFLAACATVQQIAPNELQQKWFPFIEDGKTTTEEVLSRLGTPSSQFQRGRILSYLLKEDYRVEEHCGGSSSSCEKNGLSRVAQGPYNLILSFDEKGILQKHSLIKVR